VSSLGTVDENAQQALTRIPIGRMGTVTDIAKGIVFLASDDAAFMTGAGLLVDGGTTAQYCAGESDGAVSATSGWW